MATAFPEIWAALSAPFGRDDVKERTQGGRKLHYVTGRTVMNRLDDVLGPENWWVVYRPWKEDSVLCAMTVVLPDGRAITKEDVGADSTMTEKMKGADPGDDDKGGASDALKRAAVLFGVGRYLYGDGVTDYPRKAPAKNESGHASGMYASEEQTRAFLFAMDGYLKERNQRWLDKWQDEVTGEFPKGVSEICNRWQADNHLVKWAVETGRLDAASLPEGGIKNRQIGRFTAIIYHRSKEEQKAISGELKRYIDEQEYRQGEKLRKEHPELFGESDEAQATADNH